MYTWHIHDRKTKFQFCLSRYLRFSSFMGNCDLISYKPFSFFFLSLTITEKVSGVLSLEKRSDFSSNAFDCGKINLIFGRKSWPFYENYEAGRSASFDQKLLMLITVFSGLLSTILLENLNQLKNRLSYEPWEFSPLFILPVVIK